MKTFLYLILALILSSSLQAQQDQTITITSGGLQRSFDLHLPTGGPTANLPVILCYHGSGGTSANIKATTQFNPLADQFGFIVVYPQSLKIGNDLQWNVYVDDKPGHGGLGITDAPDDILFTRDIIDYLKTTYNINRTRVFATGLSNGGFICYALSMLASNDIAAIAPVAANMWGDSPYIDGLIASGTVKPMPVMHVHGTADGVVDYIDPDNTPKAYEEYPLFVSSRVCGATTYSSVVPIMDKVDKLVFCPPPVEVFLIRIKEMGHAWTNGTYPTSLEIVKFFGLGLSGSVPNSESSEMFSISPNPANKSLRIELAGNATVELVSSLGVVVYSARDVVGVVDIPCDGISGGFYLVRVVSVKGGGTRQVLIIH